MFWFPLTADCLIVNCSEISTGISKHNTILRTVERYDPRHDKWTSVSSLNTPRSGACAVVLMGQIFVMGGGSESRKILSSCEIYHPGADKWSYGKGYYSKMSSYFCTEIHCLNPKVEIPVSRYLPVKDCYSR